MPASSLSNLLLLFLATLHAEAPADRLPSPEPERCIGFLALPTEDGEEPLPTGLNYEQVTEALNGVIQTALLCSRPAGKSKLNLTFDLIVGCDGVVSSIQVLDGDGAPPDYLACVAAVIQKADFPAHDMSDGMPVTYPVNVAW